MAKIKSYTDLEQSNKLAEILPLESADNVIVLIGYNDGIKTVTIPKESLDIIITPFSDIRKTVPCWSLAALLEVIPQSITKYIESERCQKTFHLNLFRSYYHCCSYCFEPSVSDNDGNNTLYCIGRDNWVDACYEMILKLQKLKLI